MGSIGSPHKADDMPDQGPKNRQAVPNPSRAPWEVRDEDRSPGARQAPRKGGEGGLGLSRPPDGLLKPGGLSVQHSSGGLRSHIPAARSRSPRW